MRNSVGYLVGTMLFLIFSSSCSFYDLQEDLDEQESHVKIRGSVENTGAPIQHPLMVVLVKDDPLQPEEMLKNEILPNANYQFTAPVGEYRVFVFEDVNGDHVFQEGERAGHSGKVVADEAGGSIQLTISLPDVTDHDLLDEVEELRKKLKDTIYYKDIKPGSVINLDSEVFSMANAEMGLWQSLAFIKNIPFGLFFLQEYDPNKIPVLFIHGVTGIPSQFTSIVESLDTSVYQPWVFYYPSGVSIDVVGAYLKNSIELTRSRYGYKKLVVVAHSMGGLVGRSFINGYGGDLGELQIEKFITISTPWGGHGAATMGLKYAPAVVPIWVDIEPQSNFMKELFSQPLPEGTVHYLMFGFKGSSSFTGGNSDGVIAISSQLKADAQANAIQVRGFDEDHTSILKSPAAIEYINFVLKQ